MAGVFRKSPETACVDAAGSARDGIFSNSEMATAWVSQNIAMQMTFERDPLRKRAA